MLDRKAFDKKVNTIAKEITNNCKSKIIVNDQIAPQVHQLWIQFNPNAKLLDNDYVFTEEESQAVNDIKSLHADRKATKKNIAQVLQKMLDLTKTDEPYVRENNTSSSSWWHFVLFIFGAAIIGMGALLLAEWAQKHSRRRRQKKVHLNNIQHQ